MLWLSSSPVVHLQDFFSSSSPSRLPSPFSFFSFYPYTGLAGGQTRSSAGVCIGDSVALPSLGCSNVCKHARGLPRGAGGGGRDNGGPIDIVIRCRPSLRNHKAWIYEGDMERGSGRWEGNRGGGEGRGTPVPHNMGRSDSV